MIKRESGTGSYGDFKGIRFLSVFVGVLWNVSKCWQLSAIRRIDLALSCLGAVFDRPT